MQRKHRLFPLPAQPAEDRSTLRKRKRSPDQSEYDYVNQVTIKWDSIYRYVEKMNNLFGLNVHISKGELAASFFQSDQEYKLVPFSHTCETGALFEMDEIDEGNIPMVAKDYQPGTGVASILPEESVRITRIFFDPKNINQPLLDAIFKLCTADNDITLVHIKVDAFLNDKMDDIELEFKTHKKYKRK